MTYPTLTEVEQASHYQLGVWYRFLRVGETEEEEILQLILKRFGELGGWNPELSKQIGLKKKNCMIRF